MFAEFAKSAFDRRRNHQKRTRPGTEVGICLEAALADPGGYVFRCLAGPAVLPDDFCAGLVVRCFADFIVIVSDADHDDPFAIELETLVRPFRSEAGDAEQFAVEGRRMRGQIPGPFLG